MGSNENKIKCPNCGYHINVNEILYHQLEDKIKKKFNDELAKESRKFEEKSSFLAKEKKDLEAQKRQLEETISTGISAGVQVERKTIEAELRKKVDEEKADQIKSMEEELYKKSDQLKEFNRARSEIERLKREKEELRSTVEAESEKILNRKIREEKERIQKYEQEKILLKLSEKDHVIQQLKKQLQEAHRKAEQGSVQLQGEVQELAVEEWLKENFPLDTIEEIKKGARGADCVQIINTRRRQNCGRIYYESKRAKGFQVPWIDKFKNDIRDKGVNIGVMVTETMPADMERMGLKKGIWICTFEEFKGLSVVLRESLIQISNAISSQENKGDKMNMIYDYLTSNEFRLQIEAIVEGFTQMQIDLESEKRSIQSTWKKREKQIQKVLLNTNHMYSSIKGIAGNAIQPVKQLDLSGSSSDDDALS